MTTTTQASGHTWKHSRAQTVDFSEQHSTKHHGFLRGSSTAHAKTRPRSATTNPRQENPQRQAQYEMPSPNERDYQRFVLSDPVAFSYLEEDTSTVVVERSHVLQGYQSYIVEQWVVSRSHPTFMITAFTGDSNHRITVGVLSVPANEESWSPRLKVYFKSLAQYHAKRRETPIGILMVTNIAGFPSSLTLIAVADGDVKKHREDFFVNENLKRFGCMGRSGLSLGKPSGPTQAKFYQLFRTSEKVDFYASVVDLVKLCQAALMIFGLLEPEYADGLLCDITERAFHEWWDEIGADLYNVDPKDGVVGPTTVAALLGTLIGARNRLHACGAPVGKDVFEVDATKRAIHHFQKSQHLPKTRRLDRPTLMKLHKVTAKQASAEGWGVPKAVKSTVAELSGKGGEMVMEMVGRDKASLAEIETTDIERFAQLVKGEHAKWLWLGKARKRKPENMFASHHGEHRHKTSRQSEEPVDSGDDHRVPMTPITSMRGEETAAYRPPTQQQQQQQQQQQTQQMGQADARKLAMWKRPARFARAAGKRSHHQQAAEGSGAKLDIVANNKSIDSITSIDRSASEEKPENFFDEHKTGYKRHLHQFGSKRDHHQLYHVPSAFQHLHERSSDLAKEKPQEVASSPPTEAESEQEVVRELEVRPSQAVRNQLSTADALARQTDFDARRKLHYRPGEETGVLLRRTHSFSTYVSGTARSDNVEAYPRHLSFSIVEDSVARAGDIWHDDANLQNSTDYDEDDSNVAPDAGPRRPDAARALERELMLAEQARDVRARLAHVGATDGPWLLERLRVLADLERIVGADAAQLAALHAPRQDEHDTLAEDGREIVALERERLQGAVRELETLGQRLEYEVEGLRDKVEDVESAVTEFEKQVLFTEERVAELMRDGQAQAGGQVGGIWAWLERTFGGRSKETEKRKLELELESKLAHELGEAAGSAAGASTLTADDEKRDKAAERARVEHEDRRRLTETGKHIRAMMQG